MTLAESDGDSVHGGAGGAGGGGGGGGGGGTPVKSAINQRLHDVKMPSSSVHHAVPSSAVTASNLRYIQTTGARAFMYIVPVCVGVLYMYVCVVY